METYQWYLFGHLLGAFLLVAAAGASTAVGVRTRRVTSPPVMAELLQLQYRVELFVTAPGAILAVAFGSLLVDETGWTFTQSWILSAYALLVLAAALDYAGLVPFNRGVHARARRLAADGVVESDELRAAAASPVPLVLGIALDLVLLSFLHLMIFKPGT